MKRNVRFVVLYLLLQVLFDGGGLLSAQIQPCDTLSWTWEVTTTVSTRTKTCVLEFTDSVSVDWGDGSVEWVNDSLSKETLTHVYAVAGNFICTVAGTSITYFKADSRRLLNLNPVKAPNLNYISCTGSQLTSLDLSGNTKLESLYCGGNNLQALNLSANTRLQTLTCSDNKLTRLDVSGLNQLKKVTCHTNPLTNLWVSSTGALTYLSCSGCNLGAQTLDSLFEQLPVLPEVSTGQNLFVSGNPGSTACHPELAAARKWTLETSPTKSIVHIPPVSVKMGNMAVMAVHLDQVQPIVAIEMDVALPEGLTLDTVLTSLVSTRTVGHRLSISKVSATAPVYKLLAYSMASKDTLLGRNGALLSLYIHVPDTVRTYTIDVKKVILADTAANPADVTLSDGKLSVIPRYTVGDADRDDRVNVTDIVWLVALINGRSQPGCQKEALDLDENGVWNILDVVRLVDIINTTLPNVAYSASRNSSSATVEGRSAFGVLLKQPYNVETASSSNHLYLTQSTYNPTSISLCLDNHEAVQALQADIVLPASVTLLPEATRLTARCATNHTMKLVPIAGEGHRYRILIWSMSTGIPFSGNSGSLVSLNVQTRDDGTGSNEDGLKGFMDQSVLTGLSMTTLNSFSYETELLASKQAGSSTVDVGSLRGGRLWVKGRQLRRISVFDMTSRLVAERPCSDEITVITVQPGCYLVGVEQQDGSVERFKVLVR